MYAEPVPSPDALLDAFVRDLARYRPGTSWQGARLASCSRCSASLYAQIGPLVDLPHEATCALVAGLHAWTSAQVRRLLPESGAELASALEHAHALQLARAAVWLTLGRYAQIIADTRDVVTRPSVGRWARRGAEAVARLLEEA